MRISKVLLWLGALSLLVAHSAKSDVNITQRSVYEYAGHFSFSSKTLYQGMKLGGLSGITYNKKSGTYYAISDDKGKKEPIRIYELDIKLLTKGLQVRILRFLNIKRNVPDLYYQFDFESIQRVDTGNFWVSTEGYQKNAPRIRPGIFEINKKGEFVQSLEIPSYYLGRVNGENKKGIRHNKGFESVALSRDQKNLYTAAEGYLIQDNNAQNFTRILQYVMKDFKLRPKKEFLYPIQKGGVVALIVKDKKNLLVLERYFSKKGSNGQIRVFEADLHKASNILGSEHITSLEGISPVQKEMVIDFSEVIAESLSLDNIEGFCFGPLLPDGSRLLIFVSDNNFKKRQQTQFIAYKFKPGK